MDARVPDRWPRKAAVLVSSHLMSELQDTADHLVVVGRGTVVADASVTDLLAAHATLEAAYLELTRDAVEFRTKAVAPFLQDRR